MIDICQKIHSEYFLELEENWENGELDQTANSAIDFFTSRLDEFKCFINELKSKQVNLDLEMYAKLFIFRFNMPFDMEHYMEKQSQFIKQKISESSNSIPASGIEKQKMVAQWIKKYAAEHRRKEILRQIFCIRKIKSTFLPKLEQLINQ